MAPRENVHDRKSGSEDPPNDEPKLSEETKPVSEPGKKKLRIIDRTTERRGTMIAIIGGVRAPRKD